MKRKGIKRCKQVQKSGACVWTKTRTKACYGLHEHLSEVGGGGAVKVRHLLHFLSQNEHVLLPIRHPSLGDFSHLSDQFEAYYI